MTLGEGSQKLDPGLPWAFRPCGFPIAVSWTFFSNDVGQRGLIRAWSRESYQFIEFGMVWGSDMIFSLGYYFSFSSLVGLDYQ